MKKVSMYKLYLILLIGILIYFTTEFNVEDKYIYNYRINIIALLICLILYGKSIISNKNDIFSPISIFTSIYLFMFFITPMYDIYIKEYYWFGQNLFEFGIQGSIYALLGYIIFYISYTYKIKNNIKLNKLILEFNYRKKYFIFYILLGYLFCLIANIFYLIKNNGNSILYILTLGVLGSGGNEETLTNIGIISMFSYSLPSFTLLYLEYGKNKILKILFFLIMFELQVIRGFRFFIIQIIIMFGFYYLLRNNKKLKIKGIIISILIIIFPVLLMTLFRGSLREGEGIDLSIISLKVLKKALDNAFWENLRIYKGYYGIIKVVPTMTNYLLGKQMILYTLIMFIPRFLWPGKPGNPGTEAQKLSLGKVAVLSGSAYPCLGEQYYEAGIVGIILCMGFFGWWMRNLQLNYRYNKKSNIDLMIYTSLVGIILQLVIRGYTPSNFWMIIFTMIPFWITKKIYMREKNE